MTNNNHNTTKEQERSELHRTIWQIANDLRGSVDGWDFKSYVLGMLFYRFISENLTNYINEDERRSGKKDFEADEIIAKEYPKEIEDMQAPFHLLFDHLAYIVKLAGIDHVGLGGDFDGISITPKVLSDVTKYPMITKELVKLGYSKKDIYKILGGNFIRVFKANQE